LEAIETKRGVGLFGFGGELESARRMSLVIDDMLVLFFVCFPPSRDGATAAASTRKDWRR
jgi:hypothetical protein